MYSTAVAKRPEQRLGEARLNERDLPWGHEGGRQGPCVPADFLAGANGCVRYAAIDTLRIIASIIASASSP